MNSKRGAPNKNVVVGDVGEYLIQKDLEAKGYSVGIYGKAINESKSAGPLRPLGPQVFDDGLGYSYLTYHPTTDYISFPDSKLYDYSESDITSLCTICRKNYSCELALEKTPPCALNAFPFERRSWNTTFRNVDSLCISDYMAKGYLPRCQEQLQEIAMSNKHSDIELDAEFIRDNQMVNKYIRCIWLMHCDGENYEGADSFPTGHPGRYDFVVEKDGLFAPVEVKVNTSKLSHWQGIRLSLLKQLGYSSMVAKVKIGQSGIEQTLAGEVPTEYTIEYVDYLEKDALHTLDRMKDVLCRFENIQKSKRPHNISFDGRKTIAPQKSG